ncbi:protein kinase [Sphaerisporangium sp. NPDC051011]|uniref:serine/threonine-protein kinase n=1 Tax=Sphaerisporangium sp. NPDC051011 TaxID=3155792 RepID=UPI0033C08D7A
MAQALTDEDPRRLGAFEIIGRLGEGGQGVVYLGRATDGRQVAIKLLHARLSSDPEARGRFLREVSVAQRVARFCTAAVLHADLAGNRPYIVSEYVPGPSLRQLVEREGPRQGAALDRLAISTATALSAIHRAGILHRDLKPANVLMGPEGPVVIDFGIAKALDSPGATITQDTLGTPSYLAPEQLRGAPVTPAVDLFAWGVTMVFAATGRPAFGADSIPAVINRILNESPDLSALDGPLRDIVAACLSKDPARRPTADDVVGHLMGRAIAPPPGTPGPPGTPTLGTPTLGAARPGTPGAARPDRRETRRGRRAVLMPVAAGAVAAVLAAGGALIVQTVASSAAPAPSPAAPTSSDPLVEGTSSVAPSPVPSTPHPSRSRTPHPTAGTTRQATAPAKPTHAARASASPSPSKAPSRKPSNSPSASAEPTRSPTPTAKPTATSKPTASPTAKPTVTPTPKPTVTPTTQPTVKPTPKPTPKPNPYTAAQVCGAGYKVLESHAFGPGTAYLLYNATAGKNCVVTLSKYVVPQKVRMIAILQVKGGATGNDTGNYTAYAGPVRLAAKKVCVIWGGGYGSVTWKSGWSHCG